MGEKAKVGMTYELGDVGNRFVAIFVDGIILSVITGLLTSILGGLAGSGLSFVVGVVYNWYFWTRQDGQTPGKQLMKLRVVKANGAPLTDVDALIRAVGYYISGAVMAIGYIWALFDDRKRTWHDLMAGTIVISTKDEV